MACLSDRDVARRGGMAVPHGDGPHNFNPILKKILNGGSHRRRGLARPDDHYPIEIRNQVGVIADDQAIVAKRKVPPNGVARLNRL